MNALIRVGRLIGLLTAIASMALVFLSGAHDVPEPGPVHLEPEPPNSQRASSLLVANQDHLPLRTLPVEIVVDEEFLSMVGSRWPAELDSIIQDTNRMLGRANMRLGIQMIGVTGTDDTVDDIRVLLRTLIGDNQAERSRVLLLVTCQDTLKYDGFSISESASVAVTYYHDDLPQNTALWLHEIGHMLGLKHHSDDEGCTGEECLMARKGDLVGKTLCDHHLSQLQTMAESVG